MAGNGSSDDDASSGDGALSGDDGSDGPADGDASSEDDGASSGDDGSDGPADGDASSGDDGASSGDDGSDGSADDEPATSDDQVSPTPEELADEIARLRAETEALQRQLAESTAGAAKPTKQRSRHTRRWWGSTVCVVLGALLLPISVIGRWTSTTLLDTETYVATVAPLAENEDIQEAIAFRVSEVIVDVIDVEALVRGDLPPGTRFLAGPIEAATRTLIDDVVEGFVSTDAFVRLTSGPTRIASVTKASWPCSPARARTGSTRTRAASS